MTKTAVDLRQALVEADLRVLLMVLFQLSGDTKWIEAPFRPTRDVNLIADPSAGLSDEAQAEIRAAAAEMLSRHDTTPAVPVPDDALMVELMSVCLGERVPPEYAGMMREEIGLTSRHVAWSDEAKRPTAMRSPVVIAGAGASGIALGANLVKLGIPFVIIEKNAEVGGTWLENRYPGCGVDTPNHAYSFSHGERYGWSRYFSPRDEIADYMVRSADAFGVRPHIRFNSRVVQADWDEARRLWRVRVAGPDGEETIDSIALISAIGQLSLPSIPKIEGAEDFDGPIFHSAEWPDGLDVTGKHLTIIGTGATSMQVVPTVIDQVANVTVYQRSAQWARPIPGYHDAIGDGTRWLMANVPLYGAWFRFTMLWRYGDGLLPSLRKDPTWEHPERSLNRANDRHRQQMTDHIRAELGDRADLVDKCLPDYPPYGKRILLDNGWYRAMTQPNAELVTDHLSRITRNGVETVDGKHRKADIIVLATGFKVSLMAARLNITGRNGQNLADAWADDNPTAYLGITVPGFPNMFCMQGPNTGLGHGGSAIFQAECQARYITGCLVSMLEQGIAAIDPKTDALDDYVRRVDAEHEAMIWTHPGMSTYYRNAKGRVVSVMPWRLVDYWSMTHDPDFGDYEVLTG